MRQAYHPVWSSAYTGSFVQREEEPLGMTGVCVTLNENTTQERSSIYWPDLKTSLSAQFSSIPVQEVYDDS